jgi:hypothetical protein
MGFGILPLQVCGKNMKNDNLAWLGCRLTASRTNLRGTLASYGNHSSGDLASFSLDDGGFRLLIGTLGHLTHRSRTQDRQLATGRFKVGDHFGDYGTEIAVDVDGIVAMNTSDQVGAFPNVDAILIAPFHPLVVLILRFHGVTDSTACLTCFS